MKTYVLVLAFFVASAAAIINLNTDQVNDSCASVPMLTSKLPTVKMSTKRPVNVDFILFEKVFRATFFEGKKYS
jgi:hypothetical protein